VQIKDYLKQINKSVPWGVCSEQEGKLGIVYTVDLLRKKRVTGYSMESTKEEVGQLDTV
jgi:hypothetical protein